MCQSLEQVVEAAPRRDKHTPLDKTKRKKGKIADLRNGAFALTRLANGARFSRKLSLRIFTPFSFAFFLLYPNWHYVHLYTSAICAYRVTFMLYHVT